jgi:molybdenum cofactor cytidylyltransferase
MKQEEKIGIIILAAGSSMRLGRPKQLLSFREDGLLKRTVAEAMAVPNAHSLVITGYKNELIEAEIADTGVMTVYNGEWQEGMASSIRTGVETLTALLPQLDSCILSVCDQPHITSDVFKAMIKAHLHSGYELIASSYAGTLGTPALFRRNYFKDLIRLQGREGAKKVFHEYPDDVFKIAFEQGAIDIDTEEDYINLLKSDIL